MRPSLTDIHHGEQYLDGNMSAEDAAVFEARLLTNDDLKTNTYFLRKTLSLLALYHRKKLKEDAAAVHDKLFTDPAMAAFQQRIWRLFKH